MSHLKNYRLWIFAAVVLLIASGALLRFPQKTIINQAPAANVDSINFVIARARFNSYSAKFVRISTVSASMADSMRDSVNIYYRVADSLKTVYEQSKAR
jgi:hypothetical protein